jgi:hypothetical protein
LIWERRHLAGWKSLPNTPLNCNIFCKKCCYNYKYTLPDARRDFTACLKEVVSPEYMRTVVEIHHLASSIETSVFQKLAKGPGASGESAFAVLSFYDRLWNISRRKE